MATREKCPDGNCFWCKKLQMVELLEVSMLASAWQQRCERQSKGLPPPFEDPPTSADGQTFYVPVQKLEKCDECSKTHNLRVCQACASAVYCSKACQKKDWPNHKKLCVRTERINLKTFHPFIAYLYHWLRDSLRSGLSKARHPAIWHSISHSPVPGARKASQPNQILHRTVILGAPYPDLDLDLQKWAPNTKGPREARSLGQHVVCETQVFELTTAVALALLSEVYATETTRQDSDESENLGPCFRLEYGTNVISDFGICKGKIRGRKYRVQIWTYENSQTGESTTMLDPDNHYWLYFKTATNEEVTLDCNAWGFGMPGTVDASRCAEDLPHSMTLSGIDMNLPAYLRTPNSHSQQDYVLLEDRRFSVMHDPDLQKLLRGGLSPRQAMVKDTDKITLFLERVSEGEVPFEQEEKIWWYRARISSILNHLLSGEYWATWGKTRRSG